MSYNPRPGWPGDSMLEAAMGLISNATDWNLATSADTEWTRAAKDWLLAYQRQTVPPSHCDHFEPRQPEPDPLDPAVPLSALPVYAQAQPLDPAQSLVVRSMLAEARAAAEQIPAALHALVAAESPAAAPEGEDTGETGTDDLSASLRPEAGSRFALVRHTDVTGISGTGVVAWGCAWPDGTVDIRWRGERPSSVHWASLADAQAIHGHGGATEFVWLDPQPIVDIPADTVTAGDLAIRDLTPGDLANQQRVRRGSQ